MRLAGLLAVVGFANGVAVAAQNPPVSIAVDVGARRHPIDPRIYGVAYATPAQLADLNCPLNRLGGNTTSRYNWQLNADNRGSDWYFESIGAQDATPAEVADTFVAQTKGAGAEPLVTIPALGWVAKLGPGRGKLASFSIAKYGAQTGSDAQWFPDAGNGVLGNGQNVSGNDPNDASVPADASFQDGYLEHLVGRWGRGSSGGIRYYIVDNEPSLWHATHRDVHPTGATMEEVRDKILDYGGRIKAADPTALVLGPEEWGFTGYFWSGFDQQYGGAHGWSTFPDKAAHGNADYLPWLLDQLREREGATGRRVLDVFTVHFYPQGGEVGGDVSDAMQLKRNRSTRALWDPAYVDESWIAAPVRLVPRLREWVDGHYPGTSIGITEYNWGAENHMSGATAQADVLGIYGREGLDLATRWTTPDTSTPTYQAIRLYRNYDGSRSTFGDVSVSASGPDPDQTAVFAAQRSSDGALTVMVVNKVLSGTTPVAIRVAGFSPSGPAQAWQLTAANAIVRLPDVPSSGAALAATLPAQSVTLFVLPGASAAASAPRWIAAKP